MDIPEGASEYASIPSKDHPYTLRNNFEQYRDRGGFQWVDATPPEMSVTSKQDQISCMTRIGMPVGMPHMGVYIGPPPTVHGSLDELIDVVCKWIMGALETGRLWCPPGCDRYGRIRPGVWSSHSTMKISDVSETLDLVQSLNFTPLTVSTVHAAMESQSDVCGTTFNSMYPFPRTTTPSTSLFGTSHNNSFVDMSPFEEEKTPDHASRSFLDEHVGFICAAHTSHSYEAGKARRVALDVVIRLLGYPTYVAVDVLRGREKAGEKDWLVFCVGQSTMVSRDTVSQICIQHRLLSLAGDPMFGLYISESKKTCVLCPSSGPLVKLCSNGVWADNANVHKSDRVKFLVAPIIDTSGPDFHRACLSGHYNYLPFVEHNAAIRTSISSAQIPQAVCLPWCPATAAVSPVNVFKPIVTTPTYARVMKYQEEEFDIASYLPGENVCILYYNMDFNYEDAIVVSKRYVELGGFSTLSTCRYLLPGSDYVPPVGSRLCSVVCQWWKAGCQKDCKHTKEYVENSGRRFSPFGKPTGVVTSRRLLASGEQTVRIRSYETFQEGNKLSTSHGQKGVASVLMPYEDMPICVTDSGEEMVPDIIMAVSSIVSRQTVGQIDEGVASLDRLRNPSLSCVIQPDERALPMEEVSVIDSRTGLPFSTIRGNSGDPVMTRTRGTVGYIRVFNQSQMTRDKAFTSHRSMTQNTLRTPIRRSKGGALAFGEMELQAAVAAGLVKCTEEVRRRGDDVQVHVCLTCQRLRLLHSCTNETDFAEVTLPYDTVVLDCINKIVHNIVFEYTLEPDV